ncbi:hypothetical protein PR048_003159 [Dryococelus australis]|uniref:THAP9-like helix-turn-helix domain-containing protein n=1 Tax=Dryococelus australis TaxID=614101 RepID=A0ABQ9IMD5_9NEOP|nr:hypothetical protein PR048_003159 [Dryococelus australis]
MRVSSLEEEIKRNNTSEKNLKDKFGSLIQELINIKSQHMHYPKYANTKLREIFGRHDDVAAAVTIRSISRKAYLYLRKNIGLSLPGLSTIRKWTRNLKCLPGFQKELLSVLKGRSLSMSFRESLTVLPFDEMRVTTKEKIE